MTTTKKDGYLWKRKHEHCKLCICEEFNGAKFKSPIKPCYISCKKNQAQFNEKKIYKMSNTEDQFWL